ncbi:hypothetical protein B0T18DRAFT_429714 [Schizothecium vesticola]|uniref:Uncharacterized protein n=1 Tax=Schizothecium vesticola TaxID=314040 RepID=A0AA40K5L8_9PEZI|nr:hypothetical protein B0T18DRAFT_429714 [Schizothecium vesticola]
MVRSILTFALIGLGAVNALPQIIGGGGISSGSMTPSTGNPTYCDYDKPLAEQEGCSTLSGPGSVEGGGFAPPKMAKRSADEAEAFMRHAKRQISIGKDCDLGTVQALLSAIQDIKNPYVRDVVLQQLLDGYIYPNIKKCIGSSSGGGTVEGGQLVPQPTVPGGSLKPGSTVTVPGGSLVPETPVSGGSLVPSS